MGKIVCLGDIHFRDDKPHFEKVSELFLEWYKDWNLNCKDNHLILAGDLVDKNLLTGKVGKFLEMFAQFSRFKKVTVCVGNHDIKNISGESQLAYRFYDLKDNFEIVDEARVVNLDGFDVLVLPHFNGTNALGQTMTEYYSDIWCNPQFSGHHNLVVGHFSAGDQLFDRADCIKNIDKIDADRVCLGHVHTRNINPKCYIGSVFACDKSQNDVRRAAWVYDNGEWTEEKLPLFNEFLQVEYPRPLPSSRAMVPIYTVLKCSSDIIAREHYGDIYIRATTLDSVDSVNARSSKSDISLSSLKNLNVEEIFIEAVRGNPNASLSEETMNKALALIRNHQ